MKRWVRVLLMVGAGLALVRPLMAEGAPLAGTDWLSMETRQKEYFVYQAVGGLARQGIQVVNKPYFYLEALDKVLQADPTLADEPLDNLFVFCVYESEPGNRASIDRLRDQLEGAQSGPVPAA